MRASNRVRLGKMTHPVRGFLHGSAGVVSLIALLAQPPDEDAARDGLDEAVKPEGDQGDAAAGDPSDGGDETLQDVPAHGEVLEDESPSEQLVSPFAPDRHGRGIRRCTTPQA